MIVSLCNLTGISVVLCRGACQIWKPLEKSKSESLGFETLRDLAVRRPSALWKEALQVVIQNLRVSWRPFIELKRHVSISNDKSFWLNQCEASISVKLSSVLYHVPRILFGWRFIKRSISSLTDYTSLWTLLSYLRTNIGKMNENIISFLIQTP